MTATGTTTTTSDRAATGGTGSPAKPPRLPRGCSLTLGACVLAGAEGSVWTACAPDGRRVTLKCAASRAGRRFVTAERKALAAIAKHAPSPHVRPAVELPGLPAHTLALAYRLPEHGLAQRLAAGDRAPGFAPELAPHVFAGTLAALIAAQEARVLPPPLSPAVITLAGVRAELEGFGCGRWDAIPAALIELATTLGIRTSLPAPTRAWLDRGAPLAELETASRALAAALADHPLPTMRCPSCGISYRLQTTHCQPCGLDLATGAPDPAPARAPAPPASSSRRATSPGKADTEADRTAGARFASWLTTGVLVALVATVVAAFGVSWVAFSVGFGLVVAILVVVPLILTGS